MLSVSAPPVTKVNPDIAIMITATGTAKNNNAPARICSITIATISAVSPSAAP